MWPGVRVEARVEAWVEAHEAHERGRRRVIVPDGHRLGEKVDECGEVLDEILAREQDDLSAGRGLPLQGVAGDNRPFAKPVQAAHGCLTGHPSLLSEDDVNDGGLPRRARCVLLSRQGAQVCLRHECDCRAGESDRPVAERERAPLDVEDVHLLRDPQRVVFTQLAPLDLDVTLDQKHDETPAQVEEGLPVGDGDQLLERALIAVQPAGAPSSCHPSLGNRKAPNPASRLTSSPREDEVASSWRPAPSRWQSSEPE